MFGQKMRMTGFQLRYPRTSRTLELQIENLPIYVCFLRSEHAGSGKTQFHPVSCRLLRRDLIARPIRLEQYSDTKTPATPSKTDQTLQRRYSDTTDSQFASSVMTSRRQLWNTEATTRSQKPETKHDILTNYTTACSANACHHFNRTTTTTPRTNRSSTACPDFNRAATTTPRTNQPDPT